MSDLRPIREQLRAPLRLLRDLRYAAWQLRRAPGFAAIAVLTLALGIAASTTVFAVVNTLILRPTGLANIDNVHSVLLASRRAQWPPAPRLTPEQQQSYKPLLAAAFQAFAAQPPDPLLSVAGLQPATVTVRMPGKALRTTAEAISGDYQSVFRLGAGAGRFIGRDDDAGAVANVVVSDRVWREWLGGDRSAIGRATITVEHQPFTIVGVAPRGYRGLGGSGGSVDVWIPASIWRRIRAAALPATTDPAARENMRVGFSGQVYVRTRPGAPVEAARAAATSLYAEALATDPTKTMGVTIRLATDILRIDELRPIGIAFLSLAALVLVAACANLANLLYTRNARRAGEIAIRLSLGGRRADIFRLFLGETMIIAAAALSLGLAIVWAALQLTGAASGSLLFPQVRTYRRMAAMPLEMALTGPVLLYAIGAGVFAALAVGLATAWRASRASPFRTLAASGVGTSTAGIGAWRRRALVAVQVTAAVLLLMGTGLYVQRALAALDKTVNLDTSRITSARIDLSLHDYTATRGQGFYRALLEKIATLPGVEHAAIGDGLPGYDYASATMFLLVPEKGTTASGDQARRITGAYAGVSARFLETLGLRVTRGRPFNTTDRFGAPLVTIVAESAASRLWPGEDPVGKRVMFGSEGYWRTVVGVSSDPIISSKDTANVCESCVVFVPWDQRYRHEMLVMVRSASPSALVDPLAAAIREIDPEVAVHDAATLDDSLLAWVRPMRAATWLMASLGLVSLAIATLGVYAVVSFLVSARTREFGIRLALGATPRRVVGMVLDQAVHLLLVGLLPGVLIASLGSRLLESRIRNLMPNDVPTWIAVPVLVLVVGLLAGYFPARRAGRIDPTRALRDL